MMRFKGLLLISVSIFLLGLVYVFASYLPNSSKLEAQKIKVTDLKSEKKNLLDSIDNKAVKVYSSTLDFDSLRANKDFSKFREFFSLLTTWDDTDSYLEARSKAMRNYNLSEESTIFSAFIPKIDLDSKGKSEIDSKSLNMEYVKSNVYLLSVDGDIYNYVAISIVSGRNLQSRVADAEVITLFSTDADGNILDTVNSYSVI